ncbi:hypothetical protein D5S18_01845 [Nocardia panacis]|uniref:Uncharacterized protein n=1 Tax=Nocardia panacis TaxID=2340916 RepID=A0A3A4K4D1_9NOCA|nr:hypothetical protein [Nocardia panacis]RJO80014.1 hypothetical protein D5S18_01845 [Nocardia panacis]
MAPIPDPLPHPPNDAGQGAWGSQPIYSRGDDILFAEVAAKMVVAADAKGLTHAARHLRHYLDNTGTTLDPHVDELLRDVPSADSAANALAATEIRRIAGEAAATDNYENPVQFQSPWLPGGFYISPALSQDWYYAMGAIELSTTGVVTVHKPADGADPRITAEYKVHVHDRYNWDGSKSTEIAGITVTDRRMGALHTAGLAREFDMDGSSGVRRYEGAVPSAGPINLPGAQDSRDGDRSDPTR